MHADGGHVGAGVHGGDGQIVVEIKMRAVGFVREDHHAVGVREADDGPEVRADAVVGRVVDEDGFGVGVAADGLLHLFHAHAERDAEGVVHLRVDVDGDGAAENEGVDGAAVDVARHDDLVAAADGREDHGLDGRGGAADHEEGVRGVEGFGGKGFGVLDDGDGMAEIVEHLHGVDIDVEAFWAEEVPEFGVAAAAFMARYVKGYEARAFHAFEGFEHGCPVLRKVMVQLGSLPLDRMKRTAAIDGLGTLKPGPQGSHFSVRHSYWLQFPLSALRATPGDATGIPLLRSPPKGEAKPSPLGKVAAAG